MYYSPLQGTPMKKIVFSFIFASLFFGSNAFAKRFASKFCEFELPPQWECQLEGTEWVCQGLNEDRKREAIIILAAKKRGSKDSLQEYEGYLKSKKTFSLPGGKTQVSDPKYTKKSTINGQQWVDAMHLASEVPGFYTRYLATVKGELGVAVTFSVAKEHHDAYKGLFDSVVKTLRVFLIENKDITNFALAERGGKAGADIDDNFVASEDLMGGVGQRRRRKGQVGGLGDNMLYIILAVVGVVAFIAMKKLKKGGGGKKKTASSGGAKKKKKKVKKKSS
jgi:hypothetical protein